MRTEKAQKSTVSSGQELSWLVQAPWPKREIWTNDREGDDSLGRGHQGSPIVNSGTYHLITGRYRKVGDNCGIYRDRCTQSLHYQLCKFTLVVQIVVRYISWVSRRLFCPSNDFKDNDITSPSFCPLSPTVQAGDSAEQ